MISHCRFMEAQHLILIVHVLFWAERSLQITIHWKSSNTSSLTQTVLLFCDCPAYAIKDLCLFITSWARKEFSIACLASSSFSHYRDWELQVLHMCLIVSFGNKLKVFGGNSFILLIDSSIKLRHNLEHNKLDHSCWTCGSMSSQIKLRNTLLWMWYLLLTEHVEIKPPSWGQMRTCTVQMERINSSSTPEAS